MIGFFFPALPFAAALYAVRFNCMFFRTCVVSQFSQVVLCIRKPKGCREIWMVGFFSLLFFLLLLCMRKVHLHVLSDLCGLSVRSFFLFSLDGLLGFDPALRSFLFGSFPFLLSVGSFLFRSFLPSLSFLFVSVGRRLLSVAVSLWLIKYSVSKEEEKEHVEKYKDTRSTSCVSGCPKNTMRPPRALDHPIQRQYVYSMVWMPALLLKRDMRQ